VGREEHPEADTKIWLLLWGFRSLEPIFDSSLGVPVPPCFFRLSNVSSWKQLPSNARDDEARLCFNGLKFAQAIIDHHVDVNGYTEGGNLERESAGAIGIHRICAFPMFRRHSFSVLE
jgi:hypothetical protein